MKKKLLMMAVLMTSPQAHAQFATVDVANAAQVAKVVAEAKNQLEKMQDQIDLLKGNDWSGAFGSLENNRDFIPMEDWTEIDDIDVSNKREQYGLVSDDPRTQAKYDRRLRYLIANESAYSAQQQHLANIEALSNRAAGMETPQEREELANAIALESAAMQSDQNRIATINENMDRESKLKADAANKRLRDRFKPIN